MYVHGLNGLLKHNEANETKMSRMQLNYVNVLKRVSPTLASAPGDAENVFCVFLTSSSEEHSEHTNCSRFFASSIVMSTQAGWYLQDNYRGAFKSCHKIQGRNYSHWT